MYPILFSFWLNRAMENYAGDICNKSYVRTKVGDQCPCSSWKIFVIDSVASILAVGEISSRIENLPSVLITVRSRENGVKTELFILAILITKKDANYKLKSQPRSVIQELKGGRWVWSRLSTSSGNRFIAPGLVNHSKKNLNSSIRYCAAFIGI